MSNAQELVEKVTKVSLKGINRFVSRGGRNTRDAIPTLTGMGYVYFRSELSPEVLVEAAGSPAEGDKPEVPPQKWVGQDDAHQFGVVMYDMMFGEHADLKSRRFYLKLVKEHEGAIYNIAQSIYRLGQRDPVEVVQDEDGFMLVDGFVRTVGCTMRDILAEMAGNQPHGTIRAQLVFEDDREKLRDISTHKNMMRIENRKSDVARQYYEMSLIGREEEEVGEGDEKKRKKKTLSDKVIAERSGIPGESGRQKVYQFRTVYEWCLKQGAKGAAYLAKWDAGEMPLKNLLEKATAKPGSPAAAGTPAERAKHRPRCLAYPKAFALHQNPKGLAEATAKAFPDVPENMRVALVQYGLRIAMQQADKVEPEKPVVPDSTTPATTPAAEQPAA